jgi:hypothetical protein
MKQESIGPDSAKPGSFSNEAELQAALTGIVHQVGVESLLHQLVPDRFTKTPKMIFGIASISATGS